MAEKDEKTTRTSVGVGNTEINRETKSSESSNDSYRDRDRYDRDRDRYDRDRYESDDDYQERARRGARDLGESVRDTGRTVRRESTNILTAGCDLIGGFFIGIGEAISPRGRGGSGGSLSNCPPVSSCAGGGQEDEGEPYARPRGGRTTASRTEIRRTTAR
jgi:hypothetical protein